MAIGVLIESLLGGSAVSSTTSGYDSGGDRKVVELVWVKTY